MASGGKKGRWAAGRSGVTALTWFLVFGLLAGLLVPAVVLAKPKRNRGPERQRVETQAQSRSQRGSGERNRRGPEPRIVGGRAVPNGSYRYMTLVQVEDGEDSYECGGTLIQPSYVLTAAHCVTDDSPVRVFPASAFSLVIGRTNLAQRGGVERRVTAVIPHRFNPDTFANDAALLRLDAPVPESVARPIELIGSGDTRYDVPGQGAVVTGWGTIYSDGPSPNRLLATTLSVVGDAPCADAYRSEGGIVEDVMLCAAAPRRDTCQGDSGGPLFVREAIGTKKVRKKGKDEGKRHRTKTVPIYRDIQIGITSSGEGCAEPGFPGVYTQLSAPGINDWIRAQLR